LELTAARLTRDFAAGLLLADARRPRWAAYQPGIGPHTEPKTVALVLAELRRDHPALYGSVQTGAPYPNRPRQKCDLLISPSGGRAWAVEVKMLRLTGDNGKPNDNMLMHILSPYPNDNSALTDCQKLAASGFSGSLAVLIYGYDYDARPWNRPWRHSSNSLCRGFALGLGRSHRLTGSFTRFIGVGASSSGKSIARAPNGNTCMPCSFGLLPQPRSETGTQPNGLRGVFVTDRYVPLVMARGWHGRRER
jgi:hypothetical protein